MIASRASGQRWLSMVLISLLATTMWRTWPVAQEDLDLAPPATYHHVPLLGMSLDDAIEEASGGRHSKPPREAPAGPVKTCLPFLAPILAHPSWQLRIASGYPSCGGPPEPTWELTIASSGAVTWTDRRGQVRHLSLSAEQLALVRRLDQLSGVRLQRTDAELQYGSEHRWLSIGLDLGKYEPGDGAHVPAASDLGRAIIPMVDELVDRYRDARLPAIGSMELRLATTARGRGAAYRVRIAGDRLTVKRGGNLLLEQQMGDELRLDLVDAALERRAVDAPSMKGMLYMDGWSVPVQIVRTGTGPFEEIYRAIELAQENEAWLHANGSRSLDE